MIGRGCFTLALTGIRIDLPGEKLFMPQASQRDEQKHYYGRQISESEPEEIHTETRQGQQRRAEEKRRRVRKAVRQ